MKNKKITVTIGIPAYNEEANINKLFKSIIMQKKGDYFLKKIIIVLDACTDKTEEKVKELHDKRIRIIKNKNRIGQALSQNKILNESDTDILVLLNSDILLDKRFIVELIKPFKKSKKMGIVSARAKAIPAKTFFERIINYSFEFKVSLFKNFNNSDNHYLCYGRARALSKDFIKKIKWPKIFSEDIYSYLKAKQLGFNFYYNSSAIFYYKSPDTFTDHIKQSVRFQKSIKELNQYFPISLIRRNYIIPKPLLAKYGLKFLIKNPILFLGYLLIFVITNTVGFIDKKNPVLWRPSISSKTITNYE